jgi:hypothetical protein
MKFYLKIKAGALQFVLFIGTVIALLLMGFVLLSYSHGFFAKNTGITINLVKTTDKAIHAALLNQNFISDDRASSLIELAVQENYWGVFGLYSATATHKKKKFVRTALVGERSSGKRIALYLQDQHRPLVLAGHARIEGEAYLPAKGVRRGHVGGIPYYGKHLIYGDQLKSKPDLPGLASELIDHIHALLQNPAPAADRIEFLSPMELTNSFQKPTKLISGRILALDRAVLRGNIIVQASEKIVLAANSILEDVILIAPEIEIMEGARSSFQAFARVRITLGKNSRLDYPSALVLINDRIGLDPKAAPAIFIDRAADVRGIVMYKGKEDATTYYPQIYIAKDALVSGEIYCNGAMEHKGQLWGKVITTSFMSLENGRIYQNHLFEGKIIGTQLPAQYAGLIMTEDNPKTVAKWLY